MRVNALQKIEELHREGHPGILNTLDKVTKYFVLHDGRALVTSVVKSCETCQFRARIKNIRSNPGALVKTPKHPFFLVGVDAIGPLSVTARGNRYILTGICHLTRYPIAMAVPDINEVTTGEFYMKELVKNYGVPNYLLSDRGSNFISIYVQHLLKRLGCKGIMTTSYRPQANGLCERLNGSLVSVLAKLARDENKLDQWDTFLDTALMVLRTTKNSGTGFTPAYLLFGYEMRTPAVWVSPREDYVEGEEDLELLDRIDLIQGKLVDVREEARRVSDERKAKAKLRYDARVVRRRRFEVGEEVLLKDETPSSKLEDKWEGPFKIWKVNPVSGTYYLTGKNGLVVKHPVNGDRLKTFSREMHSMVPDVLVAQANEQFQRWVNSRVNCNNFVEVWSEVCRELELEAKGARRVMC
jgi:transposase InsO family protein